MNKRIPVITSRRPQRGFTLVELMVALLISLLLMGGVVQVFSSSSSTYRNHEGLSRIQENGRFAMEFLSRDIRMADFWGCTSRVNKVVDNRGTQNGGVNPIGDITSGGLVGTEGGGANGSDSIILRGAFGTGINVESPFGPQQSSNIKVTANNGLAVFDIVLVSDCQQADIFQLTSGSPDANGTLVHNTGDVAEGPGNDGDANAGPATCTQSTNHCLSKVYGDDAQVFRMGAVQYSIINNATTGQPGLYRDTGTGPLEVVDGVNSMQILYGEDTDGDLTANYYVDAATVTDMENVVSVRIALVLQSYEDNLAETPVTYSVFGNAITAGDNRLYQVFNSTVTVRNRVQ